MEPEPGQPIPERDASRAPDLAYFTDEELDALETLAEFETEHRRILSMQTLYYRRRKAGGAA
jgi:hypothetical protein